MPRVALGCSPSPANHKSEGRPRMEGVWAYVPKVEWMLRMKSGPFSAKAKGCQETRPRSWEPGDPQVGDRVLQAGLD